MSKDYKRLCLISIIVGAGLTLLLLPTLFCGIPGLFIGTAIGSVIEVPCIYLLLKGVDLTLGKNKIGAAVGFYLLRMFLFATGMIVTAILWSIVKVPEFAWSTLGVLIGYTPMQFVVVIYICKFHPIKKKEDTK